MSKEHYDLEKIIKYNIENRLTDDSFDLKEETERLLNTIGASLDEFGGELSFYGKDPIIPSVLRYGSFSAIALAAKASQIAAIWKIKTGESQDIHVDVRKALRRFATFYEGTLETVNGHPGDMNSEIDSAVQSGFYKCKDDKWIFLTNTYPRLRNGMLDLLNCAPNKQAVQNAILQWDGFELEKEAEKKGVVAYVLRSPDEFLQLDLFQEVIKKEPLIKIEKVTDSAPVPFKKDGPVLNGIKALGLGHVIAGAGIGRALALHGADVLNIWLKDDYEHSLFHYTSNVGIRSSMLDLKNNSKEREIFNQRLSECDVFFSNRRAGFLERYGLLPDDICNKYPGIISATVYFSGESGPWSKRVGFDVSTGAFAGPYWLESLGGDYKKTDIPNITPQIGIISDYVASWLTTVGVLEGLKRRAKEGGSYKVSVSLSATVSWLLSLGIFDQEYAYLIAGTDEEHKYVEPDPIIASTPVGNYKGVKEQVEMTKTPGHYKYLLEPLCSSKPEWEKQ